MVCPKSRTHHFCLKLYNKKLLHYKREGYSHTARLAVIVETITNRLEVECIEVGIRQVAAPQRERHRTLLQLNRGVEQRVEILRKRVLLVPVNLTHTLPRAVD